MDSGSSNQAILFVFVFYHNRCGCPLDPVYTAVPNLGMTGTAWEFGEKICQPIHHLKIPKCLPEPPLPVTSQDVEQVADM